MIGNLLGVVLAEIFVLLIESRDWNTVILEICPLNVLLDKILQTVMSLHIQIVLNIFSHSDMGVYIGLIRLSVF